MVFGTILYIDSEFVTPYTLVNNINTNCTTNESSNTGGRFGK